MKFPSIMFASFALITGVHAQSTNPFAIWPEGAPGARGTSEKDVPTLTPFVPPAGKATGAAMVICPGGGYQHLAPHEGKTYAQWLSDHGITCFVLKYRLPSDGYRYPAPLQDAARALRLVRAQAAQWNIDPHRVGIIGSSAGGHVASWLLTHFDAGNSNATDVVERQSSRPDLGILCYAVISMGTYTHQGSKNNLLGPHPSPELVAETSNELRVTPRTPPCFIWGTDEDTTVPIENSIHFAEALRRNRVPFELHIYQHGHHGLGLGVHDYPPPAGGHLLPWTADCLYWLRGKGWAN